jgi:manganese/zinc/iron transport system permease protein
MKGRIAQLTVLSFSLALMLSSFALASQSAAAGGITTSSWSQSSIAADLLIAETLTDRTIQWPTWSQWRRVLLVEDYNTRIVMIGTGILGAAAGLVGCFTLLRKRALMGDALSHATLPGIGLAFLLATSLNYDGKSLGLLLCGAGVTGLLGTACILWIRHYTRLKEDTAMGIVLSVFFGGGVVVLGFVQQLPDGHAAGLESFIYGKTASMIGSDARLIGMTGLFCVGVIGLFFKELTLLCFDDNYAGSRGLSVVGLDLVLMSLVSLVTIIGLQAVGLILVIALLVIPAASARFWTESIKTMLFIAACFGAVGSLIGAALSAVFPNLPSGAMIVLVCAVFFGISMTCGLQRGVLVRLVRRVLTHRRIDRQHLFRAMYELLEDELGENLSSYVGRPVPFSSLLAKRSWTSSRLKKCVRRAEQEGLIQFSAGDFLVFTQTGEALAEKLVHDHRLWEIYLMTHADVAPGKVDREADRIEHVLDANLIGQLEALLKFNRERDGMPGSPHPSGNHSGESIDRQVLGGDALP